MKYSILFFLVAAINCRAQTQETTTQTAVVTVPQEEVGLKDIHWQLREAIKMQLPATHTDERNGQFFKKNYSISYQWSDELKTFVIELPEKRLDPETEQVVSGSKYFIPFHAVETSGVRLVFSEDETRMGISIPAKEGTTFVYHPFGNEPDEQQSTVLIGWYDRVQERTLGRLLEMFRQFFAKMEAEQKAHGE